MARPVGTLDASPDLPARRSGARRFRRWLGPGAVVGLAFLALVPLAGWGHGDESRPRSSPRPVAAVSTLTPPPSPTPVAVMTYAPAVLRPPVAGKPDDPPPRISTAPMPPRPAPSPPPSEHPAEPPAGDRAPRSAQEFDRRRQVIDIGFPIASGTNYRYRDNYGELRPGEVLAYNHVFGVRNGQPRRAHDGIDIYAPRGTEVLAPFDGVVINAARRWDPWLPERYGLTVVIVSTERATRGYAAVLAHLDSRTVRVGGRVERGQLVGTLGHSGNAEQSPAQLHFELRAPFLIAWIEATGERLVDAFNPYPSLRTADPAHAN